MGFSQAASATEPDMARETPRAGWDPGRRLLRAVRRHAALEGRRGPLAAVARRFWAVQHRIWSVLTQCEIHLGAPIGGGLLLPHPTGIVLHPAVRIGPNCLIFHQVTMTGGVVVGGHVDIGAGARLIGPITIGDHVRIGANAVVTRDVPSHCDAWGVPARHRVRRPGGRDAGGPAAGPDGGAGTPGA